MCALAATYVQNPTTPAGSFNRCAPNPTQLEAAQQRCAQLERRLARQAAAHEAASDALRTASKAWGEGVAGDLEGAAAAMKGAAARLAASEDASRQLAGRLEDAAARADALQARADAAVAERDAARADAEYLRRRVAAMREGQRQREQLPPPCG